MIFLSLFLGILLPMVTGWLLLRLLEGKTPVLLLPERIAISWLTGSTLTLALSFAANVTVGIPFSRIGFLVAWLLPTMLAFEEVSRLKIPLFPENVPVRQFPKASKIMNVGLGILLLWTIVKIGFGSVILATTPPYFDDTLSNWNLRGKVYYSEQQYLLHLPTEEPGAEPNGINGYPPLVPLEKAWLASMNDGWSELLVNMVHVLWLLSACAIVWSILRRFISSTWSTFGVYMLVSLPLYFMQGVNAYADVCLSAYLAAAVGLSAVGLQKKSDEQGAALLRIGAVIAGMLPFVKNEGLILHTTTFVLVMGLVLLLQWKKHERQFCSILRDAVLPFAASFAITSLPFLIFKVIHHLPFGNAKSAAGIALKWQPGVSDAILINTFFEGNWLLLFPLLLILMFWKWKKVIRLPIAPIAAFLGIVYFGQLFLFLFTFLSVEALMQTGYARGLIHLMPLFVIVAVLLLESLLRKSEASKIIDNN